MDTGTEHWDTIEQALKAYDDYLDEIYPDQILNIPAGRILREIDPIAYRVGFSDWLDSPEVSEDDMENWDWSQVP